MDTYKVNHNGSCRSQETGEIYTYIAGKPVELPGDVAAALGHDAELVKKAKPEKSKEPDKGEEKDVKTAPKDKMVKGSETVTK